MDLGKSKDEKLLNFQYLLESGLTKVNLLALEHYKIFIIDGPLYSVDTPSGSHEGHKKFRLNVQVSVQKLVILLIQKSA